MKYLTFAVLLAVMQASPPVPRKAADNRTSTGHGIEQNASANKQPAANSPSPVKAVTSDPQEKGAASEKAKDNEVNTVSVREFPAVSIHRDWLDYVALIFEGVLVVIGFCGVRYAIRTLKNIRIQAMANVDQLREIRKSRQQTDAMIEHAAIQAQATKDAADAAQKSAQALMDGERAWLLVEDIQLPNDPISPTIDTSISGRLHLPGLLLVDVQPASFLIKNYGKTPGIIFDIDARLEVGTDRSKPPSPDIYDPNPHKWVVALWMNQPIIKIEYIVPQNQFKVDKCNPFGFHIWSDDKITRIRNDADFLWAYGIVRYRDVYDRKHETRFCYRYVVPPEEAVPHFCLRGPEEFNKCT
jgi:hypothetical protein